MKKEMKKKAVSDRNKLKKVYLIGIVILLIVLLSVFAYMFIFNNKINQENNFSGNLYNSFASPVKSFLNVLGLGNLSEKIYSKNVGIQEYGGYGFCSDTSTTPDGCLICQTCNSLTSTCVNIPLGQTDTLHECLSPRICDGNGNCINYICGDGNKAPAEECDEGSFCRDSSNLLLNPLVDCTSDKNLCVLPNVCKPGNNNCNSNCKYSFCGDTEPQKPNHNGQNEDCDPGKFCSDLKNPATLISCTSDPSCSGMGDQKCITRDLRNCWSDCKFRGCGDMIPEKFGPDQWFDTKNDNEDCDPGKFCPDLKTSCYSNADCSGIGDGSCSTRDLQNCWSNCKFRGCGDSVVEKSAPYNEECDSGKFCSDGKTKCTLEEDCKAKGFTDTSCQTRDLKKCADGTVCSGNSDCTDKSKCIFRETSCMKDCKLWKCTTNSECKDLKGDCWKCDSDDSSEKAELLGLSCSSCNYIVLRLKTGEETKIPIPLTNPSKYFEHVKISINHNPNNDPDHDMTITISDFSLIIPPGKDKTVFLYIRAGKYGDVAGVSGDSFYTTTADSNLNVAGNDFPISKSVFLYIKTPGTCVPESCNGNDVTCTNPDTGQLGVCRSPTSPFPSPISLPKCNGLDCDNIASANDFFKITGIYIFFTAGHPAKEAPECIDSEKTVCKFVNTLTPESKKAIGAIFIVDDLGDSNTQAASAEDILYLKAKSVAECQRDIVPYSLFRHEAAHVLLNKNPQLKAPWKRIANIIYYDDDHEGSFAYPISSGSWRYRDGTNYLSPDNGLIIAYAGKSIDEDVANFVGVVVARPDKIVPLVAQPGVFKDKLNFIYANKFITQAEYSAAGGT